MKTTEAKKLIPALAAIDLGNITGTGPFQNVGASPGADLERLASTILGTLTGVASLASLLYFVIGALNWITAGGDKTKIESAQKSMLNAIMGIVVVVIAYFIASIIGFVLGINILNPASILNQ